jgi:hypothetical protein
MNREREAFFSKSSSRIFRLFLLRDRSITCIPKRKKGRGGVPPKISPRDGAAVAGGGVALARPTGMLTEDENDSTDVDSDVPTVTRVSSCVPAELLMSDLFIQNCGWEDSGSIEQTLKRTWPGIVSVELFKNFRVLKITFESNRYKVDASNGINKAIVFLTPVETTHPSTDAEHQDFVTSVLSAGNMLEELLSMTLVPGGAFILKFASEAFAATALTRLSQNGAFTQAFSIK